MKILILGAGGMVGHSMYKTLSSFYPDTYACFRQSFRMYKDFNIFDENKTFEDINAADFSAIETVLSKLKPDVVLNCIGITLRKREISDFLYSLEINSLFPQKLKCWCVENNTRLIHFSTDCVFDGSSKEYVETSYPSANDIYGKTKYLGEVTGEGCLTLRGSMLGRELYGKTELLEWAIAQAGKRIKGYSRAIYSGVSTQVMADLVLKVLSSRTFLTGVYQVSSAPISKYDLLNLINEEFGLNLNIEDDASYESRKILNCSKIRNDIGFECPSWNEMLAQLRREAF